MAPIKRLVADVLKPYDLESVDLARRVATIDKVDGANLTLVESDRSTQNVKLTLEGDGIEFETVDETITELGGTIHSVDQVVCGNRLVEDVPTPQD